jgi:uridine kinase
MVPSTGYLKQFELMYYEPGFLLRYPDNYSPKVIPEFIEQRGLFEVFREAEEWAEILDVGDVGALNDKIATEEMGGIIRISEALHEKKMAHIADMIAEKKDKVKLVLIAGPSSSGKTTFSKRLSIQLRVNGLKPYAISLDDYFVNRESTPRDETGEYDFESIYALDLGLLNEHINKLLAGEEIELPTFNFLTGQREYSGKKLKLTDDMILIAEGIHGLNETLTRDIKPENKFKIYVSALTQLNIDNHNRIPTTDVRILRRIVRDYRTRGKDAEVTLLGWPSVRRGEDKNIFPFQGEGDVMFNSTLVYELGAIKKYAEPLLEQINRSSRAYSEAARLLRFLKYFLPVEVDEIPNNSIIREFIGGSCFYKD